MTTKDEQLIFRSFRCKKNYEEDLIQIFSNIYEFCNGDLNKFILLLRKGVYPYEYMDTWERFNENHFLIKNLFKAAYIWKILQMLIIGMEKEYSTKLHPNIFIINVIIMISMFRKIHYCLLMYLKILETCVLKYMS